MICLAAPLSLDARPVNVAQGVEVKDAGAAQLMEDSNAHPFATAAMRGAARTQAPVVIERLPVAPRPQDNQDGVHDDAVVDARPVLAMDGILGARPADRNEAAYACPQRIVHSPFVVAYQVSHDLACRSLTELALIYNGL